MYMLPIQEDRPRVMADVNPFLIGIVFYANSRGGHSVSGNKQLRRYMHFVA